MGKWSNNDLNMIRHWFIPPPTSTNEMGVQTGIIY